MPFSSNRNSRDDKSRKNRSNSESFGDRKRSDKGSFNAKRDSNRNSSDNFRNNDRDQKFGRSDNRDGGFKKFDRPEGGFKKFDKSKGRDSGFKKFDRSEGRGRSEGGFKKFDRSEGRDSGFKKFDRDKKFDRSEGRDRSEGGFKKFDRTEGRDSGFKKFDKSEGGFKKFDRSEGRDSGFKKFDRDKKFDRSEGRDRSEGGYKKFDRDSKFSGKREDRGDRKTTYRTRKPAQERSFAEPEDDGLIRLNRYIANSGICSRRKADELIEAGVISVNGVAVTELGTKVDPAKDEIRYNDERLKREKMVYVLLNKPKDYITTTDDPQERKTVMQLVSKATKERIYPVGRLDRNTTGLLLLTNDGNLAEKLSHPRNNISKIYNVELDKSLTQGDFNKIQFGVELEDGFVKPDDLSYVMGASKREVGIQIHSGKNRIVRRIFESLGYDVVKLDRVVYANLTKKDLPRGRWRYLDDKEIIQLKHLMK